MNQKIQFQNMVKDYNQLIFKYNKEIHYIMKKKQNNNKLLGIQKHKNIIKKIKIIFQIYINL